MDRKHLRVVVEAVEEPTGQCRVDVCKMCLFKWKKKTQENKTLLSFLDYF